MSTMQAEQHTPLSRRRFGQLFATAVAALAFPQRAHAQRVAHPTPRAGVTGEKVASAARLKDFPSLQELFDGIRAAPSVADGIRCTCGCANVPGFYSLLSCYEGDDAMALGCPICKATGRLVVRLHTAGKSLTDIRAAVDAEFGT